VLLGIWWEKEGMDLILKAILKIAQNTFDVLLMALNCTPNHAQLYS
jgi:hypothetical protein